MKKILALFAILLLVGNLSAQRLGVQGGYSLSTPFIDTEDIAVNFNPHSGSGFHVGALFDWDMTNRWGFEASVLYNMRTMRFNMEYQSDTSTIFRREVFYLDIPIHFIVHFPVRKTRISLFLGLRSISDFMEKMLHGLICQQKDLSVWKKKFLVMNNRFNGLICRQS